MTRAPIPALLAGAGLTLALFAWLSVAPASLGGSVRYLTTSGDSMEPGLSEGDLVLTRSASAYAPGDVIAYRHPEIGTVLHRVIRRDGDTYLVKGDNNAAPDNYQPTDDDIIGAVWTDMPGAGRWLERLRTPWLGALAVGVAGFFALVPFGIGLPLGDRRPILKSGSGSRPWSRISGERVATLLGPPGQILTALLTMLALAALLLAFLAYNRPTERVVSNPVEYEQRAGLAYSATASGSVYPGGAVSAGDPIYRELVDEIALQLAYEIDSELALSGNGSYRIEALVENADGWQTVIPLRDDTPFSGTRVEGVARLALEDVESAIADFESQTGISTSGPGSYAVTILADIAFDGRLGEDVIHEFSNARLAFDLTDTAMRLQEPGTPETVNSGTVQVERETPNTVDLGPVELDVQTARMTAQAGLFLAIVGGVVLTLLMRKALTAPEPVQIVARYRSRILPIQGAKLPSPARVVALSSFDDLLRVADLKQEPILYFTRDETHYYFIQVADVVYRHRVVVEPATSVLAIARDDES